MKTASAAIVAVCVFLSAGACGPPKYVSYASINGDYKCSVPWGWNVVTEDDAHVYASTTFMGPFTPEFFLGIPSFAVRWYANHAPHRLRGGSTELYHGADDFIRQTLGEVYGRGREMVQPVHEIVLSGGRKAKHFVVLSSAEVPPTAHWGLSRDPQNGKLYNIRKHAYVVLPMKDGFYVIVYPATRAGFTLHEARFNELVNSFLPLTEGPQGAKIQAK